MRTNENFLNSLPIVASTLGNKLGVKVFIGSNECCTDGKQIWLPAFYKEDQFSREELLGFLCHEAGHVRFTDFSVHSGGLHQVLANAIEDPRIEKLISKEYPGARYLLRTAHEPIYQKVRASGYKFDCVGAFAFYALFKCQMSYDTSIEDCLKVVRQLFENHYGSEIRQEVDDVLKDFPTLSSTEDVSDCAERLVEILKKRQKNPPQQQEKEDDNDSEGDEGKEESEGSGDNSQNGKADENGSDQKSKGNPDSSESGDSKAEKGSDGKPGEEESGSGGTVAEARAEKRQQKAIEKALKPKLRVNKDLDFGQAMKRKIGEASSDYKRENAQLRDFCPSTPKSSSGWVERSYTESGVRACAIRGAERLRRAKARSVAARRALMGAIQARARVGVYTANSGRKIQSGTLGRLVMGDSRVFSRREEVRAPDTSVSLLLDLSGSTKGHHETVIAAGLAMLEALQGISGVKAQLTVFPGAAITKMIYTPCFEVVPFGESPKKYLEEIGVLEPDGGTPLAETLLNTSVQLSTRPERRKVILVVTDGEIEADSQTIVKKLVKSGLVVAGIGVGAFWPAKRLIFTETFPICELLGNFDELPQTLMKISKRLLLEGFR